MTIYLKIITSFVREDDSFDIQSHDPKEIISTIVNRISKYVYDSHVEEELYSTNGIKINDDNIFSLIKNDKLDITYKKVIAPYGAKEYHRENSLIFYFNSNENNHSHTPHIHVNYNGEEISDFLKDLTYKGKFKSKKVLNKALEYINENRNDIVEKWYMYHPIYKK